jgi:hypothetical protein
MKIAVAGFDFCGKIVPSSYYAKRVTFLKEGQMGFWKRLFGSRQNEDDGALGDTMRSLDRSATLFSAPHDRELWNLAMKNKDHISKQAVSEEYERLVLKKYGR